jgi:hypothetical protein
MSGAEAHWADPAALGGRDDVLSMRRHRLRQPTGSQGARLQDKAVA